MCSHGYGIVVYCPCFMKGDAAMSEISSAYDEMLEDTECPVCGRIGMVS